jgi:hypothetical protein
MTTKQMTSWLTTPVGDRHFPIVMIDGIHLGDPLVLIALGIDFEGKSKLWAFGKVTRRTAESPRRYFGISLCGGWIQSGQGCSSSMVPWLCLPPFARSSARAV